VVDLLFYHELSQATPRRCSKSTRVRQAPLAVGRLKLHELLRTHYPISRDDSFAELAMAATKASTEVLRTMAL